MKLAGASATQAWQPLTRPGVAAFATAPFRRLALVLSIFAAMAGISVTLFLTFAWFPTIRDATGNLPGQCPARGSK